MGAQNRRIEPVGDLTDIELKRRALQSAIDGSKTIEARRRLGQYATPIDLAKEIVSYGLELQKAKQISFFDPAMGTGVFYSALLSELRGSKRNLRNAVGIEVDPAFYHAAKSLWGNGISIYNRDFTRTDCTEQVNLLLCNPPYVRHHYMTQAQKAGLKKAIQTELGINLSGLAGLYCYFVLLAHKWLAPNAISGWLIPSEFMDVNYGAAVKEYLLDHVRLLRIHRYEPDDLKFDDALVSSCVVWFSNRQCRNNYDVKFTYGGTLCAPKALKTMKRSELAQTKKWTRLPGSGSAPTVNAAYTLGDFFSIKRGLATGDNDFFILTKDQIDKLGIDMRFFTPILPSPRHLKVKEVFDDGNGNPILEQPRYLLNCTLPEAEVEKVCPQLWDYFKSGKEIISKKYLCKSRKIWYRQEHRDPTPFLCSYMGRGKAGETPFRFVLNHSNAIATNSYLMLYPKKPLSGLIKEHPQIVYEVWAALNEISATDLEDQGRVYGGGLKKVEPKELSKVKFKQLNQLISKY